LFTAAGEIEKTMLGKGGDIRFGIQIASVTRVPTSKRGPTNPVAKDVANLASAIHEEAQSKYEGQYVHHLSIVSDTLHCTAP
jgi:hypothetical protein